MTSHKFPYVIVKPRPAKAALAAPVDPACVMRVVNHLQVLACLSPASVQYLESLAADLCHRAELQWRNARRAASL